MRNPLLTLRLWGSHSDIYEDSSLQRYDVMSSTRQLLEFQRNLVTSYVQKLSCWHFRLGEVRDPLPEGKESLWSKMILCGRQGPSICQPTTCDILTQQTLTLGRKRNCVMHMLKKNQSSYVHNGVWCCGVVLVSSYSISTHQCWILSNTTYKYY